MTAEAIDQAVLALMRAVRETGFDIVRDHIASLPDDIDADLDKWQTALIEGIDNAVLYAKAVDDGQQFLNVRSARGGSVSFSWDRGKPVDGEFRQAIEAAIARLLNPGSGHG